MAKQKAETAEVQPRVKRERRDRSALIRLSFDIPINLDTRLYSKAKKEKKSKAAYAAILIEKGLSKFDSDKLLKQALEETPIEDGETA